MGEVIAFPVRAIPRSGPPLTATSPLAATPPAATPPGIPARREPLWREVTGSVLRAERRRQHRTLSSVADRAGMSVQYLSELERGRKEASSEMLAAACGALGLGLAEFIQRCVSTITSETARAVVPARPSGPVLLAA